MDRLRAAVHRHPGSVRTAQTLDGQTLGNQTPGDQLCAAVAVLLTGNVRAAGGPLRDLLGDPDSEGGLAVAARLVQAVVDLMSGAAEDGSAERLATDAERICEGWLARLARVVGAFRTGDAGEIWRVAADCDRTADAWGALLARAAEALRQLLAGEPAQAAWQDVAARCRTLDAAMVEGQMALKDNSLNEKGIRDKLALTKRSHMVKKLDLVVDAKTATSETVHIVGANSPTVHGPIVTRNHAPVVQRVDEDKEVTATSPSVTVAAPAERVVRAFHGADGNKILGIIGSGKMKPRAGQIFLSRSEFGAAFMHGGDTSRKAAFVVELELIFSPTQVREKSTSTQGVQDTTLLETDQDVTVKVLTLYARKPDPEAEEGKRKFILETISGASAIVAYLNK